YNRICLFVMTVLWVPRDLIFLFYPFIQLIKKVCMMGRSLQIDRLKHLTKSIIRNYYTASKILSILVYLAILILLKDTRLMKYLRQTFMASFRKFSKKSFRLGRV